MVCLDGSWLGHPPDGPSGCLPGLFGWDAAPGMDLDGLPLGWQNYGSRPCWGRSAEPMAAGLDLQVLASTVRFC